MKKPLDKLTDNIVSTTGPAQDPRRAGNAGAGVSPGTRVSGARVIDGKVKRPWMIGDPWTDDYYFANTPQPGDNESGTDG